MKKEIRVQNKMTTSANDANISISITCGFWLTSLANLAIIAKSHVELWTECRQLTINLVVSRTVLPPISRNNYSSDFIYTTFYKLS